MSERLEDNIDRLSVSVSLWDDILKTGDEMDGWCNKCISQLNEGISNLSNSQRMEVLLKDFQVLTHKSVIKKLRTKSSSDIRHIDKAVLLQTTVSPVQAAVPLTQWLADSITVLFWSCILLTGTRMAHLLLNLSSLLILAIAVHDSVFLQAQKFQKAWHWTELCSSRNWWKF